MSWIELFLPTKLMSWIFLCWVWVELSQASKYRKLARLMSSPCRGSRLHIEPIRLGSQLNSASAQLDFQLSLTHFLSTRAQAKFKSKFHFSFRGCHNFRKILEALFSYNQQLATLSLFFCYDRCIIKYKKDTHKSVEPRDEHGEKHRVSQN